MSASHPTQTTNLIEMKKILITLVAMMFVNAIPTHAQRQTTRGIGVYPGRQSESFAPTLRRDFDYRNTALHRMVYHSSSLDANLTGQLVTDGTVYRGEPCRLQVSMPDGVVARRDAEKLLDGNVHTRLMVKGEDTFVQFDWTAMDVDIDAFDILAEPVYRAHPTHRKQRPQQAGRPRAAAHATGQEADTLLQARTLLPSAHKTPHDGLHLLAVLRGTTHAPRP